MLMLMLILMLMLLSDHKLHYRISEFSLPLIPTIISR